MASSPFYRFFRRFDVRIPFKTWERLPRIPGYKNEYWDGEAHYTPRPKTCDVYLDLQTWHPPPPPADAIRGRQRVTVRRLRDEDWIDLPGLFYGAFARQPPLGSWNKHAGLRAARCVLEWTRRGGDGPLVRDACLTAWMAGEGGEPDRLCGAAIVTLAPARALRGCPSGAAIPHPEQKDRLVVPHLDWVFVHWLYQRHGIATGLLKGVVDALRAGGFAYLASTCMEDNAASMMWHWRNGFRLPPGQFVPMSIDVRYET